MFEEIDIYKFHDSLMNKGKRYINDINHKYLKWEYGEDLSSNSFKGTSIDISEYVKNMYSDYNFQCLLIINGLNYHQTLLYRQYSIFECCLDSKKGYHEILDNHYLKILLEEMMKDIYEDIDVTQNKYYIIEKFPTKGVSLKEYIEFIKENNNETTLE